VDVVRSLHAAWERGDYSSVDWAHDEIEFVMQADFFPEPGTYHGLAAMRRAWSGWLRAWDGFRISESGLIDLNDRVVAFYTIRARGRSSGIDVEARVANVFIFRAGKVVRLELVTRAQGLKEAGIEE
jgi:ketosteroid isomerase-like protein